MNRITGVRYSSISSFIRRVNISSRALGVSLSGQCHQVIIQRFFFLPGELRTTVDGAEEVAVRRLDTSDLASVRTFAKEVLDTEKAIHVLVGASVAAEEEYYILYNPYLREMPPNRHFIMLCCVASSASLIIVHNSLCRLFIIFVCRSTMPVSPLQRRERRRRMASR